MTSENDISMPRWPVGSGSLVAQAEPVASWDLPELPLASAMAAAGLFTPGNKVSDSGWHLRPPARTARVFGVDYAILHDDAGGMLFVTRFGLPFLERLDARNWYLDRQYVNHGRRMARTVYHLQVERHRRRPLNLVVKFSRFAQDTLLDVQTTFEGAIQPEMIEQARFLDPFQEFGLVMELRRGQFGPADLYIATKAPLAIYRVPTPEPAWRMGRNLGEWNRAKREIDVDQASAAYPVSLEENYTYVLLYHYVRGLNLAEAQSAGLVDQGDVAPMTRRVAHELSAKGFMVLDHKPQHVIVRPTSRGLLRRHGQVVYALVDFELLVRTTTGEGYPADAHGARYA